MTREEIVTALRRCKLSDSCGTCPAKLPYGDCMTPLHSAAADLIENQQREIEALRQANEGLRFNLADAQRRGVVTPPYEADADGTDGDEICCAALEAYGAGPQVMMAIEEMSELTKELCKNGRGQENTTHIAEEIADVEIMLCQMVMLFDCPGQVEKFRRYKLERLAGRVKEKKNKPVSMSHADNIRAKTDRQLAAMIVGYAGPKNGYFGPDGTVYTENEKAVDEWEKWLKQPAEEKRNEN